MEGNSQHRLTMSESCQSQMVVFCGEMAGFVDKRGTVGVLYLDFSTVFDTVSQDILLIWDSMEGWSASGGMHNWMGEKTTSWIARHRR